MSPTKIAAQALPQAKILPRRSSERYHANYGWLNTFHTIPVRNNPNLFQFGALIVLNEDRVSPLSGFPTHPHRDAEIFSYVISGELTHRDSMIKRGGTSTNKKEFYRLKRGDIQFTTGGKGIAHSEENDHEVDDVHFLQIWALPWRRGLEPIYHTSTFDEKDKRKGFVTIISPLKAGENATPQEEKAAVPVLPGTIPIHADLLFGAAIVPSGKTFSWNVGGGSGDVVAAKTDRKVYVHLPATKGGEAKVRLAGRDDAILSEGDGAFVSIVDAGDSLSVESVGDEEAEVVIIDSSG